MKKVAISVEFSNGKSLISDYNKLTDDEIKTLQEVCESVVSGELSFLKFESNNKEHYIPKELLKQSIISLVYNNEL